MSDSENFEVEDIVNHRHKKGKVEYLIRWKGYSPSDDSWEPVDNLDCPDKIAAYNEKVKLTQSTSSARTAQKRDNVSKKIRKQKFNKKSM